MPWHRAPLLSDMNFKTMPSHFREFLIIREFGISNSVIADRINVGDVTSLEEAVCG